jgi:NAD(P)-dependent dehydrogenase (short-subunit alcohol dehydrogenase family)
MTTPLQKIGMANDYFNLSGKSAIVTGGASGIGAGIAEVLGRAGATVVIADIDETRARDQAAVMTEEGLKAATVHLDLAIEASIVNACAHIIDRFGTPWLLVNNAGLVDREMLLDGTTDVWDRVLAVNARGPYFMSREIGRAMAASRAGGRIVNIASAAVIGALCKGHAAYASSKSALEGLTRASALDLVEHSITVNTVLPGGVVTPGSMARQEVAPQGPGCRPPPLGICEPRDIGGAVLYFASALAARVTNQTLAVDGGWSIS